MTQHSAPTPCELKTCLGAPRAELVRGFVREAALAEGASTASAGQLAEDTAAAWRTLSAGAAGDERVHLTVSQTRQDITSRLLLHGHKRFAGVVASLGNALRSGAGISCHDKGIDGYEVTLHASLNAESATYFSIPPGDAAAASAAMPDGMEIGIARKGDTASIARCFLEVYGHHYIHTDVYNPHRYWRKAESRELLPVVARDGRGDVIGHLALEREPGAMVAERGEAVVLPAYRGHHLLENMSAALSEEASRQGLIGIYSDDLTIHTFTQRNDERSGLVICAALLGANPESFRPMDVACPTAGQRQSYLRTFAFLQTPAPRTLQDPGPYLDATLKLYEGLGAKVTVARTAGAAHPDSQTRMKVNRRGYGAIRFERIGANCAVELAQALRDILSLGARSVQLAARASDPGLTHLIAAARGLGFFYCGLNPAFADGEDLLLMQFLTEPLDTAKLQIYTDAAKQLMAFIDEDRRAFTSETGMPEANQPLRNSSAPS